MLWRRCFERASPRCLAAFEPGIEGDLGQLLTGLPPPLRAGVGIASMGVMRPELVMKSIVPVVMAGVLGIYGLIIAVIISTGVIAPGGERSGAEFSSGDTAAIQEPTTHHHAYVCLHVRSWQALPALRWLRASRCRPCLRPRWSRRRHGHWHCWRRWCQVGRECTQGEASITCKQPHQKGPTMETSC
jgi:hypothetical protein